MKKKVLMVYILYLAVCFIVSGCLAVQYETQVRTEKYGLSRDDSIELDEDTEIASVFQLHEDCLQGVNVRFQSDYKFLNEIIRASLFDVESGELLAENSVELKYERVQNTDSGSDIFFALDADGVKDKTVKIVFTLEGQDIYVYPSFVTSESEVEHSELYVNGEAVEQSLIFTVRYGLGTARNAAESIMNGLLWVSIGSLLFYLFYSRSEVRTECSQRKRYIRFRDKIEGGCGYIGAHRQTVGYLFLLVVLGVLFVYVYQYSVEKKLYDRSVVSVLENDKDAGYVLVDRNVHSLEQAFYCSDNNLSGMILRFQAADVSESAAIQVLVRDETTGQELENRTYMLRGFCEEDETNEWLISLSETLENSRKHTIRLCFKPIDFENTEIRIPIGFLSAAESKKENISNATSLYLNGNSMEQNIALAAEFGNVSFLKPLYIILCILLTGAISMLYFACFIWRWKLERIYPVMILCFGVIFCGVIGLDTVPDEPSHIDTAYSISNELLGIAENTKPGYIYKRMEDVDTAAEEKQSLNVYSYERLYRQLFSKAEDETLVECAGRNNLGNAGRIYYLPQVFGILAGRFLDWGMMPTMMLGRIFSLICYACLAYAALRKLPFGKTSLFLIGILPITLQQAASFSYDAMLNGISFVYLSYCLYAIYGDKAIKISDMAVILVTGTMMAMVKGGVYIALCMLPLMILVKRKDLVSKQRRSIWGALIIFVFAFAKNNLVRTLKSFLAQQGTVSGGASSTEVYTLGYLLENPKQFIGMFVNTFYKQGDSYIRNLLGGNLAWREINISWGIVFCFFLLILLSCIVWGKEKKISTGDRIYYALISFGTFCCIELSMLLVWTPVTLNYITGVQGRYFLPFFLLILIILRNSFFKVKRNLDRQIIFASGMLNVLTILQVIQRVLG